MHLFSKVSSFVLIGGLAISSLAASVPAFAEELSTPSNSVTSSKTTKNSKIKEAREKVREAKKETKLAKTNLKKARVNYRLQKAEVIYNTLLKKAEAKSLDTSKIKADIEILKAAELKLKTDLDASATKDALKADRDAIKTTFTTVRSDAKDLRTKLQVQK